MTLPFKIQRILVPSGDALVRFRFGALLMQPALFGLSVFVAFQLRFEFTIPPDKLMPLVAAMVIFTLAKSVAFALLGLNRGVWRYFSTHDLLRLIAGNLLGTLLAAAILFPTVQPFPRSVYGIDFLVCLLLTAGMRVCLRMILERSAANSSSRSVRRCLIYGAGDAGVALLRELRQNSALAYRVCGFLDDDLAKNGKRIQGLPVLCGGAGSKDAVRRHRVELILIAIPSATGAQIARMVEHCNATGVAYKTVPGFAELIEGNGLACRIRDISVEDLLQRAPVRLDSGRLSAQLEGRTILVTGAAGSIGSELCRQIARFRPAAIVGYEIAESPLFEMEREMARAHPDVRFVPEVGSIQNKQRLSEVFDSYRPSVVYHAAAYKHVPLMEAHVWEAVENNALGTLNVALAAADYDADDFVMISSDKAVHPTNMMGASKRLAELIIGSVQTGGVKFTSVRFGNVLGSSGSVVRIFKDQIARGGPVTVTHPEMRRFFMTIPEAAQLVLQSSTMGKGGEIFVLEMGHPMRIVDLARNLILLSGLRPDRDIKIEFSGIRPGEKLYEEINALEEHTRPTYHDKIKIFSGPTVPWPVMLDHITNIREICEKRDLNELILKLKAIVPEYNPSGYLLSRVLKKPAEAALAKPLASRAASA